MSTCPRCKANFTCTVADKVADKAGDEPCWCMKQAPIPADMLHSAIGSSLDKACLCPDCLRSLQSSGKDLHGP